MSSPVSLFRRSLSICRFCAIKPTSTKHRQSVIYNCSAIECNYNLVAWHIRHWTLNLYAISLQYSYSIMQFTLLSCYELWQCAVILEYNSNKSALISSLFTKHFYLTGRWNSVTIHNETCNFFFQLWRILPIFYQLVSGKYAPKK